MSLADKIASESKGGSLADRIAAEGRSGRSLAERIAAETRAGSSLADRIAAEGEITNAPATWGDVGSTLLNIGKAAVTPPIPGLTWDRAEEAVQTPQEHEAFYGTLVPSAIVAGSLLSGNPMAGVGLKPFLARAGVGVGTGAAARASIAAARGEDVTDAVLDPTGIMLDAGMSAIPELWAGTKYAANALTPDAIQQPLRRGASAVLDRMGRGTERLMHYVAKKYPRYGERLVADDLPPLSTSDLFDRPPIDLPELADTPVPGRPAPERGGLLQVAKEKLWQGPTRHLRSRDDQVAKAAGLLANRRNNIESSLREKLTRELNAVLEQIPPEGGEAIGAALESPYFAGNVPMPPNLRGAKDWLADIGETRVKQGVWDKVKMQRALELMDEGPAEEIAHQAFAPAQPRANYLPHMSAREPDTGRSWLSGIERVIADDPEATTRQAMRRLKGMTSGNTVGSARSSNWEDYTTNVHDVLPRYAQKEIPRIANASVFGGKPVDLVLREGEKPILVGEKAADIYDDFVSRGRYEDARAWGSYLADVYGAGASDAGAQSTRTLARMTSDMALSHSALTQVGQAHTPIWASGGPRQIARGKAMVDANPELRELFEVGPKRTDFLDYVGLGRGEALPKAKTWLQEGPADAMRGIEHWLRGPDSYATLAMIDDVAQQAKALSDAGQPYTRALLKQADEMGIPLDHMVRELTTDGTLSRGTWLEGIQNLVKRWQYSTEAGEIPAALRTPTGALLAQYKTYGIKASQHVKDDIVDVVVEGLRTGDRSMLKLGAKRALDFAAYGAPSNAATGALKAIGRGRAPSVSAMLQGSVSGPTGIVGETAYRTVDAFTPEYGEDPFDQLTGIPALSVPADAVRDVLGAGADPGRAALGAVKLGGAYDPRLPFYGTTPINMMRSLAE